MATTDKDRESLLRERREALRPLRALLEGTPFGLRLPDVSTGTVFLRFGEMERPLPWSDAGDREAVLDALKDLMGDCDAWYDRGRAALSRLGRD